MSNIAEKVLIKSKIPVSGKSQNIVIIDYDNILNKVLKEYSSDIDVERPDWSFKETYNYLMARKYTTLGVKRFLNTLFTNVFFTKECIIDILRDAYLLIKSYEGKEVSFYLSEWDKNVSKEIDERIKYCNKTIDTVPDIFKLSEYSRNKKKKKENSLAINVLRAYYTPMNFKSLFNVTSSDSDKYEREEIVDDLLKLSDRYKLPFQLDDYICFEKILNLNTANAIYDLVNRNFGDSWEKEWDEIIMPLIKKSMEWPGSFSRIYVFENIDFEIDVEEIIQMRRNHNNMDEMFIRSNYEIKRAYFKTCLEVIDDWMAAARNLYEAILSQVVYEIQNRFGTHQECLDVLKRNIDFYINDGDKTYYTYREQKASGVDEDSDEEFVKIIKGALRIEYTYTKQSVLNELYFVRGIEPYYDELKRNNYNYPPQIFLTEIKNKQLYIRIQKQLIELSVNL